MVAQQRWMSHDELRTLTEKLMIYDPHDSVIENQAEHFVEERPANHATEPADDMRDVRIAMNRHTGVRWLIFNTHGCPGHVSFEKESMHAGNVGGLRRYNSTLTHDARVLFVGCSVGEGRRGRNFLITAGRNLLVGKGGVVGATTSANFSGFFSIFGLSSSTYKAPWGKLRVMRFNRAGNLVSERLFD